MELLYIWIYNYKCIKNQEFNFSSKIRFHFDVETKTLSKTSDSDFNSNTFFSTNREIKNIENVSVITGQNGSGKSTIASFLFEFLVKKEPKESLIITKEEGSLVLYNYHVPLKLHEEERLRISFDSEFTNYYKKKNNYYIRKTTDPLSHLFINDYRGFSPDSYRQKLNIQNLELKQHPYGPYYDEDKSNFIYYSPHFSSVYHFSYSAWHHDISTTCLIETDWEHFENNKPEYNNKFTNRINSHILNDYYRIAAFLANRKTDFFENIQVMLPLGFNINVDNDRVLRIEQELKDSDRISILNKIKELLPDEIVYGSDSMKKHLFICSLVKGYLFTIVRNFFNKSKIINNDIISKVLNISIDYKDNPIKLFNHFRSIISSNVSYDRFDSFIELLAIINNVPDSSFKQDGEIIYIRYSDLTIKQKLNSFTSFMRHYSDSLTVDHYLSIFMYPKISSGEYSFLIVFSRLYDLLIKEEHKDNLLFFDELEVTLHPELQRSIIDILISFLTIYFPKRNFQLIFASHSPILLSDVPRDNAIFLRKDNKGFTESIQSQSDTFGSNIHTLYRASFFLEDGVKGIHSENVINHLIQKAQHGENFDSHDNYILSQIGEPILKKSIEMLIAQNSNDELSFLRAENKRLKARLGENDDTN